MIIFLAYEGFELIANTAGDLGDPERTLPRAYYSAVLFVIVLYVLVAAVSVGNLPVPQIVAAKDYALAEAARPFLGQAGFTLIAIAALLSTASAINATLYGAARLSYVIAKDGEPMPKLFLGRLILTQKSMDFMDRDSEGSLWRKVKFDRKIGRISLTLTLISCKLRPNYFVNLLLRC